MQNVITASSIARYLDTVVYWAIPGPSPGPALSKEYTEYNVPGYCSILSHRWVPLGPSPAPPLRTLQGACLCKSNWAIITIIVGIPPQPRQDQRSAAAGSYAHTPVESVCLLNGLLHTWGLQVDRAQTDKQTDRHGGWVGGGREGWEEGRQKDGINLAPL